MRKASELSYTPHLVPKDLSHPSQPSQLKLSVHNVPRRLRQPAGVVDQDLVEAVFNVLHRIVIQGLVIRVDSKGQACLGDGGAPVALRNLEESGACARGRGVRAVGL